MENAALKLKLKEQLIQFLNLHFSPADIADDAPFFDESGLGLDSIDSIELIVLLERHYGIKIEDPKEGRKVLVNVNTMADYIEKNRTK